MPEIKTAPRCCEWVSAYDFILREARGARGAKRWGVRSEKSARCFEFWSLERFHFEGWAYGSASASRLLSVHPTSDRSDNLTYSSA
jgi:hypothetical protein